VVEHVKIADRRAAAVFGAVRQRHILLELIAAERSPAELSRLTDTSLSLLHHHMRNLLRLGLVRLVRTERRAGAPIRRYRAAARSFFVPAELMAANPGVAMNERLRARLDRSLAGAVKGAIYSHDGSGPRMRLVAEPSTRGLASELWLELRLSRDDAEELAGDLRRLFKRYAARGSRAPHRYLVHAAMAAETSGAPAKPRRAPSANGVQ
jgi:DNA-binding transcriptional ArsR family regulator